jgi:hypothetical protein
MEGFQSFYWKSMVERPEIRTVQIVSDEPYIPWEMLRGTRRLADGRYETDTKYLCQRFALSRWLAGPSVPGRFPLREVVLVAPQSNLRFVKKEVDALSGSRDLRVRMIDDIHALRRFLAGETADVLHFACHGHFESEDPGRSSVVIGDRAFETDELTGQQKSFGRTRPLVFLNACNTSRLGVGLTGLDGWAKAFLDCDVGFFVGCTWQATDELACELAIKFYGELQKGATLGEAMQRARNAIARSGDATYLAYTLYANPTVRATRASTGGGT